MTFLENSGPNMDDVFWLFLVIFVQPSQNRFFFRIYVFINRFLKMKQNKSIRCRVIWPCTGEQNPREFPQPVQGEIEYLDSPWAASLSKSIWPCTGEQNPRDFFHRCRVNWPCTGEKIPWDFFHRCKKKSKKVNLSRLVPLEAAVAADFRGVWGAEPPT